MNSTIGNSFLLCIFVHMFCGNSSSFIFKWPFSFFLPATTTGTVGAGTINYGFLRPAILVPVTTTTAATTTTTRPPQFFINTLGGVIPVTNNSVIINVPSAVANRPVVGGIAQPLPSIVGGGIIAGGVPPQIVGGIAGAPVGGELALPNGFPASGGVAASGVLPGFFPGIIGRSSRNSNSGAKSSNTGRIVFSSKK